MRDNNTINKIREVAYVAKGFMTGLTDLVLVVRKPDGSALSPAATFTEQSGGVYIATYTPDQLGVWEEKITSISNSDHVIAGYQVVAYDDTDNETAIASVGTIASEIAVDTDTIITDIVSVGTADSVAASIALSNANSNATVIESEVTSVGTATSTAASIALSNANSNASAVIANTNSNATVIESQVSSVGVSTSSAASTIESTALVIESIATDIENSLEGGGYIL